MLKHKLLLYGVLCLCIWLPYDTHAQSVKRQCISSYASSGETTQSVQLSQTVGQAYYTAGKKHEKISIFNGFQQPIFKVEKIEETKEDAFINMKVFPNPAKRSVNLQSPERHSNLTVIVTNAGGQTVLKETIPEFSNYSIQTAAWKNGIYFISVKGDNTKRSSFKLIINN